jgi:hypothetical protein
MLGTPVLVVFLSSPVARPERRVWFSPATVTAPEEFMVASCDIAADSIAVELAQIAICPGVIVPEVETLPPEVEHVGHEIAVPDTTIGVVPV